MTKSPYKRFSRVFRRSYPSIAATLALVVALVGVPGVTAGGLLVSSKQIKNNSITSKDIRQSAVKTTDLGTDAVRSADIQPGAVQTTDIGEGQVGTTDIGTGQVSSADIGQGEVTPGDVTMPDPVQIKVPGTFTSNPTMSFSKLADLGAFTKSDGASALEVNWTGSVEGHNGGEVSGCVFQLRIDGAPAPGGGGEVFGQGVTSISAAALFGGIPAGPHQLEMWARLAAQEPGMGGDSDSCTVGPAAAGGISQTIVVSEHVI